MTYEQLENANKTIKTTDIKGKEYAKVNQRIKVFRMLYPDGELSTEIISNENGVVIMKATARDEKGKIIGTGTAYEKENSTFINKTSYIENCETSAVGRALGMCGIGIDTAIRSAEEVENAELQQTAEEKIPKVKVDAINEAFKNKGLSQEQIQKGLNHYGYEKVEDIKEKDYMTIYTNIMKGA